MSGRDTANPVLIETTRGGRVESRHRGAFVLADAGGSILASARDARAVIFPRSSYKLFQTLPLVESGAAEAFGLSPEELALASASHSGEPMHTEKVAAWLARLGLGPDDLKCGAHPPRHGATRRALILKGDEPSQLHNNCSGKHAGFLTLAKHLGAPIAGYTDPDHPVQKAVAATLSDLAGLTPHDMPVGTDGCSAPNFGLSLDAFARALAKTAALQTGSDTRDAAAQRLMEAMAAHPELVAGTGRCCTALITASGGKAIVKVGAEGVYSALLPAHGLGLALRIDDGAERAANAAMAACLARMGLVDPDDPAVVPFRNPPLKNFRGVTTGDIRPAPEAFSALPDLTDPKGPRLPA